MGAVWVAEQIEPVRRKVALKLIKAGMDSKSVLARFEAERQALAVMDHPNIAKVLDSWAGTRRAPPLAGELPLPAEQPRSGCSPMRRTWAKRTWAGGCRTASRRRWRSIATACGTTWRGWGPGCPPRPARTGSVPAGTTGGGCGTTSGGGWWSGRSAGGKATATWLARHAFYTFICDGILHLACAPIAIGRS